MSVVRKIKSQVSQLTLGNNLYFLRGKLARGAPGTSQRAIKDMYVKMSVSFPYIPASLWDWGCQYSQNTGCPVQFIFQMNDEYFLAKVYSVCYLRYTYAKKYSSFI
jgi:hypothetical protein